MTYDFFVYSIKSFAKLLLAFGASTIVAAATAIIVFGIAHVIIVSGIADAIIRLITKNGTTNINNEENK